MLIAVVQRVDVGESPVAVAAGAGSVWVASAGDQSVTRLEPRSGRVLATCALAAMPLSPAVTDGLPGTLGQDGGCRHAADAEA